MSLNNWSPNAAELVDMVGDIESCGRAFGRNEEATSRALQDGDEEKMKRGETRRTELYAESHGFYERFVWALAAYTLFGPPDPGS